MRYECIVNEIEPREKHTDTLTQFLQKCLE